MEKETLEEAAERLILDNFIKVAPKQKVNAADILRHYFKAGAKWQAERMYSEEEVIELLKKAHFVEQNIDEWFEQNKKK